MIPRFAIVPSIIGVAHALVLTITDRVVRRSGRPRLTQLLPWLPRRFAAISGTLDVASGLFLFVSGMRTLGTRRAMGRREGLETGGVYRYVRNPLYTGVVLVYWGSGWLLNRTHLLLGALIWMLFFLFAVKVEGRWLLWDHGDAFREYRKEVPAFIPAVDRMLRDLKSGSMDVL